MSNRICLLISFVFVLGLVAGASAQPTYLGRTSWWSDLDSNDHDWSRPDNWWTMDRYQDDVNELIVYVKVGPNEVPDVNTSALIGKADGHAPYPLFLNANPPENDPCITSGTFTPPSISVSGGYHLDPFVSGSSVDHSDTNVLDPCYAHYLTMSGGTVTVGTPQTMEGYDNPTWYDGEWWGRWGGSNVYIGTTGWRAAALGGLGAGLPSGTMTMTGGTLNVGGHMEVGSWEEAHGTLDMTGGTINITQGLYAPASWWGAGVLTGQVNLHGGTINARYFTMIQDPYVGNTGNLDIEAGKMVLGRNEETKIQGYANGDVAQMSITVYGTTHGQITGGGQRAALNIDYDVSADGKTTVFASLTDPCQAWAPSPPDGAQNAKGPPANLARPVLSWSAGDGATSHLVYFGTGFAEVNDATTSSGEYKGSQALTSYTVDTDLDVFGTYHWRIDEANAVTVKGQVWDFTVGNLGKASYPVPADTEDDVSPAVTLGWTAGIYATTHDVYFGTSFSEVNDANTNSDAFMAPTQAGTTWATTGYDPNGLGYSTTYYWRIDEQDGGTFPGNVWSFTTNSRFIVDNFNSYANLDPEVYAVWNDYTGNPSDGELWALETNPDVARDGNSIQFKYYNTTADKGKLVGSWMDAKTSDLEIGSDWTLSRAAGLVLYFRGTVGNSVEKMWVELEDTSANAAFVVYDGDANDIAVESWHEWNIDLAAIDACGVTLSSLDNIKLGVGGFSRGGQGKATTVVSYVHFDDIEVWASRCRPEVSLAYDWTDDCVVDAYDLEIMTDDWLMTDYNTLGYAGTLKNFPGASDGNYDNCWVTGGKVGSRALEFGGEHSFDPGSNNNDSDDYVEIPPLNVNTNTITFSAWVKRGAGGAQDDDGGIVFCSRNEDGPGTTYAGLVMGLNKIDNSLGYNWDNSQSTWGWNPGLGVLPENEWAFVALAVAADYADIYIMKESTGIIETARNTTSHVAQPFGIVTRIGDHKGRNFKGLMDDVRIYDYTLDANDIEYLAKLGGSGTVPDGNHLQAHYEFEETTGLEASDSAGAGVNYWPVPSVANICGDGVEPEYSRFVNLIDFSCFADYWMDEQLWP